MNYLKKSFLIVLLFFLFTNTSFSNEPVAYVDIDIILKNSDIGKEILEKINTQNNKNIQDLKKKEKILKDLEIEIASKKNIISKEAFDEEVINFRKNVDKFSYCPLHLIVVFQPKGKKEDLTSDDEIPEFIEKKIKSA